tara:strand:+ start:1769 stop:2392 length:624 start_codon:yes stop_codon:yes gene_type:complete
MNKVFKYKISEDLLFKCKKFGIDSINSSIDKYALRHGFDINDPDAVERALNKFSMDICIGKIGEELVYSTYSLLLPNLSKPDYNIYSVKQKSWDSDLKDLNSNISIAVKTQDIRSMLDNDESWVFQMSTSGKDTDKEIFNKTNDNHYVAFVSLNIPKRIGELKALVKVQWLHDKKLFKQMKLETLRNNKLAVYFEDLEFYKDELWQI